MWITVNDKDYRCIMLSGGFNGAVISIDGSRRKFSADFVIQYDLLTKAGLVKESRFIDLCVDAISGKW